MLPYPSFYTRTALAKGLQKLLQRLEEQLQLTSTLYVYLAGGMAVHLYTASRVTTDVDAEFSQRLLLPNDLMVEITLEDGTSQLVYLDTNYNPTFALLHENYLDDAIKVDLGLKHIQVYVLSPVDLAVSKIARLSDNDKNDIATLVSLGLTTPNEIEERAASALAGYIGGQSMLLINLKEALAIAKASTIDPTK